MGHRVLIIDDSSTMRAIVQRVLGQTGLEIDEVLQAKDGIEGLRLAIRETPDFILTDINMPNLDGVEMIRQLRRHAPTAETPVIVISTEGSEEIHREAMEVGANAYVQKPFTPESLVTQLEQAGIEIGFGAGEGAGDF